nr:2-amino-4-hydroxy-6-hydroxymethyldihydropteridine diphosphokinase [Lyngbya sp. PCC 8106]
MYRDSKGQLINADCNGAANIIRKINVSTQQLAKVVRGVLSLPHRYFLDNLSRSYRKQHCEADFNPCNNSAHESMFFKAWRTQPQELLTTLLAIEDQFGRVRQERWGARTLDLDVLLFGDLILETPDLQIPHPRMTERGFVLVPLAEIAPDWVEPVSGEAISQLVKKVDCSGVTKSVTKGERN